MQKMGKTLEINGDKLNTNLSRITAYTVRAEALHNYTRWMT